MSQRVLVLALLATTIPVGLTATSSPEAPAVQPDLQQQVNRLVKRVGELQTQVKEQHERLTRLENDMGSVASWFRMLPGLVAGFSSGLDGVYKKGFTFAGANLQSRELLLKTLRSFGKDLTRVKPEFGKTR